MDIKYAAPESNTSSIIIFGITNLHKKISNALLDWTLGPSTPTVLSQWSINFIRKPTNFPEDVF